MQAQTALKYDVEIEEDGKLSLQIPFARGMQVAVFVVPITDAFDDLVKASESSLNFWDNPYDDEDWNHV